MPPEAASSPASRVVYPARFWWLTGFSFLLALSLGGALVFMLERTRSQDERQATAELANLNAREIGDRLERALSASFALAAVIRQGGGRIDRFEALAGELIRTYGGIGALVYAPDNVVRAVVPLAGNERLIGFNPLLDPKQAFEVRKAMELRRLVLTGPFELVQGGYGVVGRQPVFLDEGGSAGRFWGFIHVTIRINDLLAVTSLGALEASGFRYELWRTDPQNGQKVVFAHSSKAVRSDTVEAVINVPGGQWTLGVTPRTRDARHYEIYSELAAVLMLAVLAALAMAALQREPLLLRREIETRAAAEAELQRSAARLQEIIETLDSGLVVWDSKQKLRAWNGAFARMFPSLEPLLIVGLPRAELASRMREVSRFSPEEEAEAGDWDAIDSWERQANDGRIFSMQRLATADGGRLVLHHDITEERRSANLLARNERMASLGKLVAGIAHEINTPIGNALMVASTLTQRVDDLDRGMTNATLRKSELTAFMHSLRESDALIIRNLERAAELVQHFKQVAVDQASDRRRHFDLAVVLEEIVSTLNVRLRRTPHALTTDFAPGIAMDSFPGAIGQVISNLVDNSLLHAFAGRDHGTMRLATRALTDARAELEFSDDGAGIPAADLHRVFDPFFTTRLGHGGSGLGLSIVLNLVQDLLGGKLEVDSTPGKGTRFRIVLPLVAPQRANPAGEEEDGLVR